MCVQKWVVTFGCNADNIDVMAHGCTAREELLTEDHGLNPNFKPDRQQRGFTL